MSSIGPVWNKGVEYRVEYNKSTNSTEFSPTEGGICYIAKSNCDNFTPEAQFRLSLADGILELGADIIEGFDKLLEKESNIELNGLPDSVHNQLSMARTNILTSSTFGNVVTGVLKTACEIGEDIPIVKDVIGKISEIITPEAVGNTINKTLKALEENFFENIENDGNYNNLKNKFFEKLSLENVVNTTQRLISYSTLFATGLLTNETVTMDEVLDQVKCIIEFETGTSISEGVGNAISFLGNMASGITGLISGLLNKD